MSGGRSICRARLCDGVSPVRVSMRIGQPHLGDRRLEIAGDVDGKRLQRRDVEGVKRRACSGRAPARAPLPPAPTGSAGSRRASCRRRSARRAARSARPGLGEQVELMRPRLPAAAFEPAQERLRKERFGARRHGPKVGRAAQGRKSRGIRLSPPAGLACAHISAKGTDSPLPACGERVRPSAEQAERSGGGEGAVPEEALGPNRRAFFGNAPSPSPASQACRLRRPSPRRRGEAKSASFSIAETHAGSAMTRKPGTGSPRSSRVETRSKRTGVRPAAAAVARR